MREQEASVNFGIATYFQQMLNDINCMGAGAQFIKNEDIFRNQILLIHLIVDRQVRSCFCDRKSGCLEDGHV